MTWCKVYNIFDDDGLICVRDFYYTFTTIEPISVYWDGRKNPDEYIRRNAQEEPLTIDRAPTPFLLWNLREVSLNIFRCRETRTQAMRSHMTRCQTPNHELLRSFLCDICVCVLEVCLAWYWLYKLLLLKLGGGGTCVWTIGILAHLSLGLIHSQNFISWPKHI